MVVWSQSIRVSIEASPSGERPAGTEVPRGQTQLDWLARLDLQGVENLMLSVYTLVYHSFGSVLTNVRCRR